MVMKQIHLDFYGVRVLAESNVETFIYLIKHDFSYFNSVPGEPDISIIWEKQNPDYNQLPRMKASIATPRNICFEHEGISYIDYFGRALNIYDPGRKECRIFTEDPSLAHEIAYLTILSRVSDLLDRKGIHRIHALGLTYRDRAFLILLPCGGGKTTLALRFLTGAEHEIKLISEDSPLIDSRGNLLPFPIRIGVLPSQLPEGIDESCLHEYDRMEHGRKITIDLHYFKDRICTHPVRPGMLILGERFMGQDSVIEPAGRMSIFKYSLMSSVIGVGLYQGLEFMSQKSLSDSLRMGKRLLSRMRNNRRLISKSGVYRFMMGRDIGKNVKVLTRLIKEGGY